MGIIDVALLGEKDHGRHDREGKGGKQGFSLSLVPAWPHGELQGMKNAIELHTEAREAPCGIPLIGSCGGGGRSMTSQTRQLPLAMAVPWRQGQLSAAGGRCLRVGTWGSKWGTTGIYSRCYPKLHTSTVVGTQSRQKAIHLSALPLARYVHFL